MGRRSLFVAWAAVALSALPAAAAYLQAGVDAARTGDSPDAGPEWPDVALRLDLEGQRALGGAPVLLDGVAYVTLNGASGLPRSPLPDGAYVWAVDLATGATRAVVEQEGDFLAPASDGERLFVVRSWTEGERRRAALEAYALRDGSPLWSLPIEEDVPETYAGALASSVTDDGVYLAAYWATPGPAAFVPADSPLDDGILAIATFRTFVVRADPATGREVWRWDKTVAEEQDEAAALRRLAGAARPPASRYASLPLGISVNGPWVHVTTIEGPSRQGFSEGFVWTLRAEDGAYVGYQVSQRERTDARQYEAVTEGANATFTFPATPTGDGQVAYMRLDRDLVVVNPARNEVVYRESLGELDTSTGRLGSGFALREPYLYATTLQGVYRIDTRTYEKLQATLAPARGERWSPSGLVLAGDLLYGRAQEDAENISRNTFYAFDAVSLAERWRYEVNFTASPGTAGLSGLTPLEYEYAVGEGVMLLVAFDGGVTVLGRTPASPRAVVETRSLYPQPGDAVEADLSRSAAGLHGPPTAYRADWGDGAVTEWQADPLLRHAYAEPGARTARFHVRNDAGQTASETLVFRVGEPAPNLLSRAFARENQDTTFFVLGLAATAVGGAFGLWRIERRRGLLRRELAALQAAFDRTKADPQACEAVLAERKARAAGLLADGALDETQFAVLKQRVDELGAEVRLAALDERFHYLPHGMVLALREMLADGRVTRWEREHFLLALERDTLLTPGQKEQVRTLVDSWFRRDAGRP